MLSRMSQINRHHHANHSDDTRQPTTEHQRTAGTDFSCLKQWCCLAEQFAALAVATPSHASPATATATTAQPRWIG